MPNPGLSKELAQQALDIYELYRNYTKASAHLKLPERTFTGRVDIARRMGLAPTVRKDAARIYTPSRLGRMHLVIPDCQVKPGVSTDHLEWISNYILEKKPDVIINIGDFADMDSLNKYDKGTLRGENKRLISDLKAAKNAMGRLMNPILACKDYKPELHLTMGNHEDRLSRFANQNPEFDQIIGVHMLRYQDWGWTVHPFTKVCTVDGVEYAHYFITGESGRPVTSAAALLRKRHRSAIMGHNQKTDIAFQPTTHQWAIFCGLCALHDEPYLGPQGNFVRRQILVLHEVEEGRFDPMFVSLRFLQKAYS